MFSEYFIPSQDFIKNLQVGDIAPNCFGEPAQVVSIHAKQQDINGKWFVCFYTRFHENSSISNSLKEGQLRRHACLKNTSAELDKIEREMLQ